jgi:hypothetical protein
MKSPRDLPRTNELLAWSGEKTFHFHYGELLKSTQTHTVRGRNLKRSSQRAFGGRRRQQQQQRVKEESCKIVCQSSSPLCFVHSTTSNVAIDIVKFNMYIYSILAPHEGRKEGLLACELLCIHTMLKCQ